MEIKCEYCGAKFTPINAVQKYCSKFCKRQAAYKRNVERGTYLPKSYGEKIFQEEETEKTIKNGDDLVAIHYPSGMFWTYRKNAPRGADLIG